MPRPADVTEELIAFCDDEMRRYRRKRDAGAPLPFIPDAMLDDPACWEIWYAGCWLGRHLEAAGCSLPERKAICHEHGSQSFDECTWAVAERMLATYRATHSGGN